MEALRGDPLLEGYAPYHIARAEIRLLQVRELGLDAILEARYVTQDAYWLEFRGRDTAAPVLDKLMDENPALQLRARACL